MSNDNMYYYDHRHLDKHSYHGYEGEPVLQCKSFWHSHPISHNFPAAGFHPHPGSKEVVNQDFLPPTKINLNLPNPFTVYPIETQWDSNELILDTAALRVASKVSPLDVGLTSSSRYVTNQHLKSCIHYVVGPRR